MRSYLNTEDEFLTFEKNDGFFYEKPSFYFKKIYFL